MFLLTMMLNARSQNLQTIKTYFDPYLKTQLEEVYTVIANTPTKHGTYKRYDKGGTLVEEAVLSQNQINEVHKIYYGSEWVLPSYSLVGKIHIVETYVNGTLVGLSEQYQYVGGKKCFLWQKTYNNKGEEIKSVEYYESGVKSSSVQVNGHCVEWYENGQKSAEYTNKNGDIDGKFMAWHENGALKAQSIIVRGNRAGKGTYYFPNGVIQSEEEYNSMSILISSREYFMNSKPKYEKYAVGDNKFKEFTNDSVSGNKLSEIDLIMINTDSNPELIINGKRLIYYASGKIKEEEFYDNGRKTGKWKKYHEGGELKEVVNYE